LYLGAVEVKSISRRVSRAMIKGAATAQKAAANLIASTRRVVPFNYMRGGHPRPELPTAHQTPHSSTSSRTLRLFLFFSYPWLLGRIFQFYTLPKRKKRFHNSNWESKPAHCYCSWSFLVVGGYSLRKIFMTRHFKKFFVKLVKIYFLDLFINSRFFRWIKIIIHNLAYIYYSERITTL